MTCRLDASSPPTWSWSWLRLVPARSCGDSRSKSTKRGRLACLGIGVDGFDGGVGDVGGGVGGASTSASRRRLHDFACSCGCSDVGRAPLSSRTTSRSRSDSTGVDVVSKL
jgi:hypothetical protein